ncbi:hypothetical protein IEQ34_013018 [Dendrobium chrysotoxum]|uniref:N-acetyltransferase domain-containing protein n=1 Tax=Dendrobium chrysotoxum TaxID=161865 RepID=A0AAV7GPU1_DENCH|nr:hypothetical protein IEQ34_013018 [Dendrobium chrysotoxum]
MEAKQTSLHLGNQDSIQNQPPAIFFRPFESSRTDFDAVMDFGSDQHVNRTLQFDLFTGRDDAVRFIETIILPHPWFRFICLSDATDDRPIGSIVLRPENAGGGRRRVSIGYSVVPELWGKGIATVAVRMAVAAAFEQWPEVERVQALVFLNNPASQRVLEKAGFQKEGVLRKYLVSKGELIDVAMYSFIAADCRAF